MAFWYPCIHACPLSRSMPQNPCCVSMSMLHFHVHALLHAMSMLHVHVKAAFHVNATFYVNASCPCLCPYTYVEMLECRTVRHPISPVPDWEKLMMPEQVRYCTKLTQYRTKIRDAGMPMPPLVSWMLMPSYTFKRGFTCVGLWQN